MLLGFDLESTTLVDNPELSQWEMGFRTFESLKGQYNMSNKEFYKYLQVRNKKANSLELSSVLCSNV